MTALRPVQGFESTPFAWQGRRLVWDGIALGAEHPRNLRRPWAPQPVRHDAEALHKLPQRCRLLVGHANAAEWANKGLLPWFWGGPLPFPLNLSQRRFDTLREALVHSDAQRLCSAAVALLGAGPGLTPSGDDLVGGIFFALHHRPVPVLSRELPEIKAEIRRQAIVRTNPISARLMADMMAGRGWRAAHELLAAADAPDGHLLRAAQSLLTIGASSGADMLTGMLLGLSPDTASVDSSFCENKLS